MKEEKRRRDSDGRCKMRCNGDGYIGIKQGEKAENDKGRREEDGSAWKDWIGRLMGRFAPDER